MLDAILSSLYLLTLDANDPAASPTFLAEARPGISYMPASGDHSEQQWASTLAIPRLPTIAPGPSHDSLGSPCDCSNLSLSSDFPVGASTLGRDWLVSPGYHPYWTEAMVVREQCRILVWSACVHWIPLSLYPSNTFFSRFALVSAYSLHQVASVKSRTKLRLTNPSNVS